MDTNYKARIELSPGTFQEVAIRAKDLNAATKLLQAQYSGKKVFSVERA